MKDKLESSKQKVVSKVVKDKENIPEDKLVTSKKKLENSDKTKVTKTLKNIQNTDNEEHTTSEVTAKAGSPTEAIAKAGKRSAKAIKEKEEKQEKIKRKETIRSEGKISEELKPSIRHNPPRAKVERRSKKYREVSKLIDKSVLYSVTDAIKLAAATSPVKFDATLELHIRMNVDPKQADQNIRGTVVLPAGTGKTIKVAVVCEPGDMDQAKKAGADIIGGEEFLQQLNEQTCDFDLLIATPSIMPKLGKYARLLGPKGIMPNIKSGTVTKNIEKAVKEAKAGRIEYRVDSTGIIHAAAGKISFSAEKLESNVSAILSSILSSKPASVKGNFVESIYITTTMGPSIKVDPSNAKNA